MGHKCSSNYLPILLVDILLSRLHCWRDSIGRASNIYIFMKINWILKWENASPFSCLSHSEILGVTNILHVRLQLC